MNLNFDLNKKYLYLINLVAVYLLYINLDMDIYKCSKLTHIFAIIAGLLCMYYDCNIIIFIIGTCFFNFHTIHQIHTEGKK